MKLIWWRDQTVTLLTISSLFVSFFSKRNLQSWNVILVKLLGLLCCSSIPKKDNNVHLSTASQQSLLLVHSGNTRLLTWLPGLQLCVKFIDVSCVQRVCVAIIILHLCRADWNMRNAPCFLMCDFALQCFIYRHTVSN